MLMLSKWHNGHGGSKKSGIQHVYFPTCFLTFLTSQDNNCLNSVTDSIYVWALNQVKKNAATVLSYSADKEKSVYGLLH